MTLGEALKTGRTANLDPLRLGLAACVIVSHAWPLALGPGTAEPLSALTGTSLGGWAVALFFFLSGLLVTASAERRGAAGFWIARARRILPGLGAALLATLALAYASGASAGLAEAAIWLARAITLVSIEHRLTDAFAANPYPAVVNGPLWTLFHEVAAYGLCAGFVRAGGARRPGAVLALVAVATLAALAHDALPGRLAVSAPLFLAFALGMAAHVFRAHLRLRPGLAVLLLPLVFLAPWPVAMAAMGYGALALALCAPVYRLDGDYSFGLYLYGWPVAQTVVQLQPGIGPAALALASLVAAIPFAVASWHLVERPGLARRPVAA